MQFQCDQDETTDTLRNRWICPCGTTSVDNMPEIGIKLANLDKNELLYQLNSKDYFFYPYYEGLTSPVSCVLSFEYMVDEASDESH